MPECFINMDIALGDVPLAVPKHHGNREFGEAEIAGDAAERIPQRVSVDSVDSSAMAYAVEGGTSLAGGRAI